jgi:hypothetical protein
MPWQYLAMPDETLEQADIVRLNLAVASGIPGLKCLDIEKYVSTVDGWTAKFRAMLPGMEQKFHATPHKWKNDIRFFRVGMLQGFLGHIIGVRYSDEQKYAKTVYYKNPSDLFLNGIIDTLQGTCGNMATLHVAIARRMGWPVSIACAKAHLLSRYDDGEVVHNIEATSTHAGTFASDPDAEYIKRFNLPQRATECGSDLRRLTAREMLGVFLALRARHYQDTRDLEHADSSYALARVLFPSYRDACARSVVPFLSRAGQLFDSGEIGHPDSIFQGLAPTVSPGVYHTHVAHAGVSIQSMSHIEPSERTIAI